MDRLVIQGGVPLQGELTVSGAKNSALPALAACLLTAEPVTLRRIPSVRDIHTMAQLLESCGASVCAGQDTLRIQAAQLPTPEAPYDLVKTMRASSLVLGPLVARCGRARVSCPAAAPSAHGPSTCTWPAFSSWGPKSVRRMDTSRWKPPTDCAGRPFTSTASPSPAPRTCSWPPCWPRARPCFPTPRASPRWRTWRRCSPRWAPPSKAPAPPSSASGASTASAGPTMRSSPTVSKPAPSSPRPPSRGAICCSAAACRNTSHR